MAKAWIQDLSQIQVGSREGPKHLNHYLVSFSLSHLLNKMISKKKKTEKLLNTKIKGLGSSK